MWDDYRVFRTIVDEGSLSAAGRKLRISPAMVSKRLAHLEERLGARLLHRTTRRLSLTTAGKLFYEDVVAILDAASAAEARVAGVEDSVAGPLRVTAPTSFGRLHVAPYLSDFLARHPRVELTLNLSDGFVDLIADRVDLAVRIAPEVAQGLIGYRLGDSPRILCAAPAYLEEKGVPADVSDFTRHLILAADGQMPWRLEGPEGPITVDRASHVKTNSSEVVRELTLAGVGISLRSLWDVARDIAEGRLVRILPELQGSSDVGIFAVHPDMPRVPANVSAFIEFLSGLYAPPAPWEA